MASPSPPASFCSTMLRQTRSSTTRRASGQVVHFEVFREGFLIFILLEGYLLQYCLVFISRPTWASFSTQWCEGCVGTYLQSKNQCWTFIFYQWVTWPSLQLQRTEMWGCGLVEVHSGGGMKSGQHEPVGGGVAVERYSKMIYLCYVVWIRCQICLMFKYFFIVNRKMDVFYL